MDSRAKNILVLAIAMGLSFSIMILSCAFSGNWLAVTLLVPLILIPIPIMFMDLVENNDSESARATLAMMHALIGALVVAFYGIPVVAYHAEKIETTQFILWLLADLLTTGAIGYYFYKRGGEQY